MSILGRIGRGVRGVDDVYSDKFAQMYARTNNPVVKAAGYMVGGAHPSFRLAEPDYRDGANKVQQMLGNASKYAIPAVNAVPKYVLPAAGITAAGMGLMELAQALSPDQQSSGTIMP